MRAADITFAVFLALVAAGALAWHVQRKRARSRAVAAWAGKQGWAPISADDWRLLGVRERAKLFQSGGSVSSAHAGDAGEFEMLLLDYGYVTGPTGNRRSVRQTVVMAPGAGLDRPPVRIRPRHERERVTDRAEAPAGDPDFDDRYVIEVDGGERAPLPRSLIAALRAAPVPPTVEMVAGQVLVYRKGRLIEPADLTAAAQEARHLRQCADDRAEHP